MQSQLTHPSLEEGIVDSWNLQHNKHVHWCLVHTEYDDIHPLYGCGCAYQRSSLQGLFLISFPWLAPSWETLLGFFFKNCQPYCWYKQSLTFTDQHMYTKFLFCCAQFFSLTQVSEITLNLKCQGKLIWVAEAWSFWVVCSRVTSNKFFKIAQL